MGFYLLAKTTSEQIPPFNKDHLILIIKYLVSLIGMLTTIKKRPHPYEHQLISRFKVSFAVYHVSLHFVIDYFQLFHVN